MNCSSNISEDYSKNGLFIACATFSLGVLGNVFAISCLLYQKYRRQMRIPGLESFGAFKTLVLTLLSVDLAGILMTSPLTFYLYTHNLKLQETDFLCKYSAFWMLFFGVATMASLTTMAVERLMAIRRSLRYRITSGMAKSVSIVILLASAMICVFPTSGLVSVSVMNPGTWCFANWYSRRRGDMIFNIFYASIGVTLIATTVLCNILSVKELLSDVNCSSRPSPKQRRRCGFPDRGEKTEHVKVLIAMTCIYVLCWLPLIERFISNQLSDDCHFTRDRVAIWLACLNPVLDPWVYILLQRRVMVLAGSVTKKWFSTRSNIRRPSMTSLTATDIAAIEVTEIRKDVDANRDTPMSSTPLKDFEERSKNEVATSST